MTARRRTAGLSPVAARMAARPASSPMAPSAATAASRQSGSSWSTATSLDAATVPGATGRRSPHAHAAASTTVGSGSPRRGRREGARGRRSVARPASSAARRRTEGSGSAIAVAQLLGAEAPEPGQGAEGHDPDPGIGGPKARPHRGLVVLVPGEGHVLGRRIRCHGLKSVRAQPTERGRHHEKENVLSHMVIYRTADGQPGYHQAEELDEAVRFVERLRNGDGVDGARIFRMEEVNFDFRPYFKVEIGPGGVAIEAPVAPAFAGRDLGFVPELANSLEAAPAAPAYEAPAAFDGEVVGRARGRVRAPAESADLAFEPEPLPSFVAPPSVSDPSVIDALPNPPTGLTFDPPAPGRGRGG